MPFDEHNPVPNIDEAIEFLKRWHSDEAGQGFITLITIDPDLPEGAPGKTRRYEFAPFDIEDGLGSPKPQPSLRSILVAAQGVLNCYTPVNLLGELPTGKTKRLSPAKYEIQAARAIHVDADFKDTVLDPEASLARCRAFDPPPSLIIESGGGHWPLWMFTTPYDGDNWQHRVESANGAVHLEMGADPTCRNINRIMRVPGTINMPNETKRKLGRVPVVAHLVEEHWDRRWSFEEDGLPRLPENMRPAPTAATGTRARQGARRRDRTRSGRAYGIGHQCARAGKSFEEFCSTVRDDPETADWYREKGTANDDRELKRVWDAAELPSGPPWEISLKAPYDTAKLFRKIGYTVDGLLTLYHHKGCFYAWNGMAYVEMAGSEVRAKAYSFLDKCVVSVPVDKKGEVWEQVPVKPNTRNVNELLDALRADALLPEDVTAPDWLYGDNLEYEPQEIVVCTNGLLHLPTMKLLPRTPAFFAHNALDYAYDPNATAPQWRMFLDEVFLDDAEAIDALQEIFGYALMPDTSQQKIFLLVGPKRSGKGTIARVLRQLIGPDNVAGPTLSGMTKDFGLQPLIDKLFAIISDARLDKRTDSAIITERLLSISGEDAITINRKYLGFWTGRLLARFLVLTNELPSLSDVSGALASRCIILPANQSFYGKEDPTLTNRLLTELPGILNWAIAGWQRLSKRGYFIQPASGEEQVVEMEQLGSPVQAFIRDRCEVGPKYDEDIDRLFDAWELWCMEERVKEIDVGTRTSFGRNVRSAVPGLTKKQHKNTGKRFYLGVRLKREADGPPQEFGEDAGAGWNDLGPAAQARLRSVRMG
jgi:putative DNA primase/helicase